MAKASRTPKETPLVEEPEDDVKDVPEGLPESTVEGALVEKDVQGKIPEAPEVVTPVAAVLPEGPDIKNLNYDLLMNMLFALGMSNHTGFVGVPGVRKIGQLLGATDYAGELEVWRKIKEYKLARR